MAPRACKRLPGCFFSSLRDLPHHSCRHLVGPQMVPQIHSHPLRQPCSNRHRQQRLLQLFIYYAVHALANLALFDTPVHPPRSPWSRPLQWNCWFFLSFLFSEVLKLGPSCRRVPDSCSYVFCLDVQSLNPAFMPLIIDSQNSIVNSVSKLIPSKSTSVVLPFSPSS